MSNSAAAAVIPPARATHSNVAKADKGGNRRITLSIQETVNDVYSLFFMSAERTTLAPHEGFGSTRRPRGNVSE
jgi:hypothetical protein